MMLLGNNGKENAKVLPSPICCTHSNSQSCNLPRLDRAGMQWPSRGTEPGSKGTPAGIGILPTAWRQCVRTVTAIITNRMASSTGELSTTEAKGVEAGAAEGSMLRTPERASRTISKAPPILIV
jgi:hypothetical protein